MIGAIESCSSHPVAKAIVEYTGIERAEFGLINSGKFRTQGNGNRNSRQALMSVLFIALPIAILMAAAAVIAFVIQVRNGQYDDLDTPPRRMLYDDRENEEFR